MEVSYFNLVLATLLYVGLKHPFYLHHSTHVRLIIKVYLRCDGPYIYIYISYMICIGQISFYLKFNKVTIHLI